MIDIVDQALIVYTTVTPTLFVDDLSEELDGDDDIRDNLGGFTQVVVKRTTADGMEVSESGRPGGPPPPSICHTNP